MSYLARGPSLGIDSKASRAGRRPHNASASGNATEAAR